MRAKGNVLRAGHRAGLLVSGVRARGFFIENVIEGNLDGVVLREGSCPTLERNTITGQTRRGLLVCARGQGTVTDNEISDNLDANVEVRGELEKFVPEEQAHSEYT